MDEGEGMVSLDPEEYPGRGILIATYHDLEYRKKFACTSFHAVICDGIYYLKRETVRRRFQDKEICFIGFTSQVGARISG